MRNAAWLRPWEPTNPETPLYRSGLGPHITMARTMRREARQGLALPWVVTYGDRFVGAGDVGTCAKPYPIATGKLLDGIPGTVFLLGDNAYPDGSDADYQNCFAPAWGRLGLVPDAGSAYFLPRLVGFGRTLDLVFTGEPVSAEEALRIGLVTRVWPDAEFADRWRELARDLAAGATEAFALTKEEVSAAMAAGLPAFLDVEATLQDRAGRSRDYAEGVRAFAAKRRPEFEGR